MQDKSEVRIGLLKRRDAIPPEVRRAKDRLISEKVLALEEIRKAGVLFFFVSFRSEIGTSSMMQASLARGQRIAVPKVDTARKVLLLYEIKDLAELTPGYMGIPEPSVPGERRLRIGDVDSVLLPGAGYDYSGNRIGYGGGYYDRLLSGITKPTPLIAPAYEEQVVESIPAEPHDIRVDLIVTDKRVIRCGESG